MLICGNFGQDGSLSYELRHFGRVLQRHAYREAEWIGRKAEQPFERPFHIESGKTVDQDGGIFQEQVRQGSQAEEGDQ